MSGRRRRLGALLAAAGVAVACSGEPVGGAGERRAAQARLEALVGPFPNAAAGGEAGAILLAAVRRVETAKPERDILRRMMAKPVIAWSADESAALARSLAEREGVLAAVERAAAAEPSGLGIPVPLADDAFARLQPLLSTARLLTLAGRAALRHGDAALATAHAETVGRLLHAARSEPWMLTQMVALPMERDLLELLAEAIAVGDRASAEAVASGLRRLDEIRDERWVAGEAMLAARTLDRRDERLPQAAALDAAWVDLVVARALTRQAEMAVALAGGEGAFRHWCADWRRRQADRERIGKPRPWARLWTRRSARADATADMLADLVIQPGNAEKRAAALPARHLALLAAGLAFAEDAATAGPESMVTDRGETPRDELRPDGSRRLSLPRAMAEWRQGFGRADLVPLRFEWELPAPGPQAPNAKREISSVRPRS